MKRVKSCFPESALFMGNFLTLSCIDLVIVVGDKNNYSIIGTAINFDSTVSDDSFAVFPMYFILLTWNNGWTVEFQCDLNF